MKQSDSPPDPGASSARDEIASIIGVEAEVTFRDGTKDRVKVLEVGYDLYDRYIASLDDERACIELFCGQEKGWAARLTAGSHNDLMQKGQGLNLPLLEAYLQRRKERTEMISPGLGKRLEESMMQIAREKMEELMRSVRPNSSEPSPAGST